MTNDDSPSTDRDRIPEALPVQFDRPALVVFDFDGTLAAQRGSWGLCYRLFGVEAAGDRRTDDYWDGDLTFEEWCAGNVADWRNRGVTREHLRRAAAAIKLTTGAETLLCTLDDHDIPFGILSSGIADLIASLDRFDPAFVESNEVVYDDGVPVDAHAKVGPDDKGRVLTAICERRGVDPGSVLYVGDSHSDVEAFEVAGTAVLFDPDDRIAAEAHELVDHVESERDLERLVPFVLGASSA